MAERGGRGTDNSVPVSLKRVLTAVSPVSVSRLTAPTDKAKAKAAAATAAAPPAKPKPAPAAAIAPKPVPKAVSQLQQDMEGMNLLPSADKASGQSGSPSPAATDNEEWETGGATAPVVTVAREKILEEVKAQEAGKPALSLVVVGEPHSALQLSACDGNGLTLILEALQATSTPASRP